MRRSSAGIAVLAGIVLAACNSAPVAPEAVTAHARFTGYTYGSGNAVAVPPSPTTTATAQAVAGSDTTSRGGYTYRSGN